MCGGSITKAPSRNAYTGFERNMLKIRRLCGFLMRNNKSRIRLARGKPGGENMKGKKVLPPTYLWVAVAIMLVLHPLFPLIRIILWP
jgi:hypothetical protein